MITLETGRDYLGVCLSILLFVFALSSFSFAEELSECSSVPIEQEARTVYFCNSKDELVYSDKIFQSTGTVSVRIYYKNNSPVRRQDFSSEGEQTSELDLEFLENGAYIQTRYPRAPLRAYISGQALMVRPDPNSFPLTIARWAYDVNKEEQTSQIYEYMEFQKAGSPIPKWRAFYNEKEKITHWHSYSFDKPDESILARSRLTGVNFYDQNRSLTHSYTYHGPYKFEDLYGHKSNYPPSKPLGLVVVDDGFETDHPVFRDHWYQNPLETFNGLDDDNNGMIDDVYGYNIWEKGTESSNIRPTVAGKYFNSAGIESHGSHVTGIAIDGIKKYSIAAFAGDYELPHYLKKISKFITQHKPHFANFSFTFWNRVYEWSPTAASFKNLSDLISENKDTLFFIAAGNEFGKGTDLDQGHPQYPASYTFKNMVVVGALDATEIPSSPDLRYTQVSKRSYVGRESVDIFAPGIQIKGPAIGKRFIKDSGTSMATPFALNVVFKGFEEHSGTPKHILKKLLLMSAYIPDLDSPLPCKSGGALLRDRFLESLKNYHNGFYPFDAVITARLSHPPLEGESHEPDYVSSLKEFWSSRGI